jgi:GTPase SAR1 family protein
MDLTLGSFVLNIFAVIAGILITIYYSEREARFRKEILNLKSTISRLEEREGLLQKHLALFKDYGKKTPVYESNYLDVIMLGPRNAGKTSLCSLWTTPWTRIERIAPTEDWEVHDVAVHEGEPSPRHEPLFDVERTYIPQFRLKIFDYAGEDHMKAEALESLPKKSGAVLVLMFPCTHNRELEATVSPDEMPSIFNLNQKYFSAHFLKRMAHLPQLHRNVKRVFVVFNKIDVLPGSWHRHRLVEGHNMTLNVLGSVFGEDNIEHWFVSTDKNTGIIGLLGAITKLLLETDTLPSDVEKRLGKIGMTKSDRKGT